MHIRNPNDLHKPIVAQIYRTWQDHAGQKWINACWYYRPEQATGKLALVLVPPAGSTLFTGMDLGDGDRPEHYPYARAGFAVASFEIDGHVPNLQKAQASIA